MFNSNSCAICSYTITDPVCLRCYIKQTEVVLNDLKLRSMAREIILKKVRDRFPIETLNDTECVLCREENVTLCGHCFSVILTGILRKINFPKDLMENFEFNRVSGIRV